MSEIVMTISLVWYKMVIVSGSIIVYLGKMGM